MSEKDTHNKIDPAVNRRNYLKLASMAGAGLGTGIGAEWIGTELSTPVRAATTVVDDFTYSSGGLSDRYEFAQDGGNATVTSASAVGSNDDDSNVLEVSSGNSVLHAFEDDGDTDLNAYPNIGDTFSCWIRGVDSTGIMNFSYGAQDKDNKYYVQLNLDSAHLGLFKYESGSGQSLAGDWSNSTIQNNSGWFKVEIQWTTDHTHTVTLYQNGSQVTSFSYTEDSSDPQFTATGVGYSAYLNSGETAQFDYTTTSSSDSDSTAGSPSGYCEFDSFEGSNLDAYDFDQGSAGEPGAHFVSSPTVDGSQALAISNSNVEMISTSGLNNYPSAANNTLRYWVQVTDGDENINVSYGVQDHQNRYYVKLNYDLGWVGLFKYEDGSGTTLEGTSLTLSPDVWYRVEIDWESNGSHTVTLVEDQDPAINDGSGTLVAQFSGNDSTWRAGGIGYDAYLQDGGTAYFEAAHSCQKGGC